MFQSLSTRALLLAVAPTLIGIVFAVVIGLLCLKLDSLIRKEGWYASAMSSTTKVCEDYLMIFETVMTTGKVDQLKTELEAIEVQLKHLCSQFKDDPELSKTAQNVVTLHESFKKDSLRAMALHKINPLSTEVRTEACKILGFSHKEVGPVFDILFKRSAECEEAQKLLADQVAVLFVVGLLANFSVSIVLVYSFSKHVVKRVAVLHENATALSMNQIIEPQLEGNDEIKQLESKLVDLSNELAAARQRKKDFLSMVGHDLRSPLTSLQMMLEMFEEGLYGQVSTERKAGFHKNSRSLLHLIQLISDLLDLEKIEVGSFSLVTSKINPTSLIERVVSDLSKLAQEEGKVVEFSPPPEQIAIEADEDRLRTALNRIITACLMETSGPVRIKSSLITELKQLHVSVETHLGSGHHLVTANIFNPTDLLGETKILFMHQRHSLALAREILRLHGGDLEFQSHPGFVRFRAVLNVSSKGSR